MAVKKNDTKNLSEMGGFAELVEKRREEIGGDGKSFVVSDFGQDWHIAIPELQTAEWNDAIAELRSDLQGGYISQEEFRDEYIAMYLGDQAEDFKAAVIEHLGLDPMSVLTMALTKQAEDSAKNPTRPGSRNIRRQQKRR